MKLKTPMQDGPTSCVPYGFAFAIEDALRRAGPQYMRQIDRHVIKNITGFPIEVLKAAERLDTANTFDIFCVKFVLLAQPALVQFPIVVSYWADGIAHCVVAVGVTNTEVTFYDPAYGEYRKMAIDNFVAKTATYVVVLPSSPTVTNSFYDNVIGRFIGRLLGLID